MVLSERTMEVLKDFHAMLSEDLEHLRSFSEPDSEVAPTIRRMFDLEDAVEHLLSLAGQEAVGQNVSEGLVRAISDMLALLPGVCGSREDGQSAWDKDDLVPAVSGWDDRLIRTAFRAAKSIVIYRYSILYNRMEWSRMSEVLDRMAGMEDDPLIQGPGFQSVFHFTLMSRVPTGVAFEAARVLSDLRMLDVVRSVSKWDAGIVGALEALCRKARPDSRVSAAEYLCAEKWALVLAEKHIAPGATCTDVADLLRDLRIATENQPDEVKQIVAEQAETFSLSLIADLLRRQGALGALATLEAIGRESLLQEKTNGKISLIRHARGERLSPDAVMTVADSGAEARTMRIFVRGCGSVTRQLIDVAVVSVFVQRAQPYTSFLVPGVGIIVTDATQAERDVAVASCEGRIRRLSLISAYKFVLSTPGTACLAMALREYADVIAQSFVVSGVRGERLRKLMDAVYSDDTARKALFTSDSRRVGDSIMVLPELVNFETKAVLGIIAAENSLGGGVVAPIIRNRMKAVEAERGRLLNAGKSTDALPTSEALVKDLAGIFARILANKYPTTVQAALTVVEACSRRSSESWDMLGQVLDMVPTLLTLETDGEERQKLLRAHPETVLKTLEAALQKDPFETYKDKITPDEIKRWERALETKEKPLLPLGLEAKMVVEGRQLTGKFLERRDRRGILLGEITDCCQCPRGIGKAAAWFGHEDPRAGYFVAANAQGMILCMSMVWVDTQTNTVVFDNIEHNRFYGDNSKAIELSIPAYQQMAELLVTKYNFSRIQCGCEHSEWVKKTWEPAEQPIPISPCSYTDAKEQVDLMKPIKK